MMHGWSALRLAALLSCCASASAQEGASGPSKIAAQFAKNLELTPSQKPARVQDARLAAMFVDKVSECYLAEAGAAIGGEDHALLVEFAPELVPQFAAALRGTTCDPSQPASAACLTALSKLDCEPLAAVVRQSGWDRAPSPEMEAAIEVYTAQLAERYQACQSGDNVPNEESKIRTEYMTHSSSLQIAMLLTTGQCSLVMERLPPCTARIAALDACKPLLELAQQSRLTRFCSEFLDCSAEPALVGKIAK